MNSSVARYGLPSLPFLQTALLVLLMGSLPGCGSPPPSGPSYAEALQVYNGEMEALDRLQQQRDALAQQLEGPNLGAVSDVLKLGQDMQQETLAELQGVTDPNELLDRAAENSEGLLGRLGEGIEAATELSAEKRAEIETQIAALDEQIAAQQKRVERARADKDKADAARNP